MNRLFLATLVITTLSSVGCQRQPDVLILFVDTLRHDRLGCETPLGAMPSLEQYLSEGACFERVASTAGWTLPTETSMLYSAYPEEHLVEQRHSQVSSSVVPITAPLLEAGYQSALFSGNVLTTHPQYQPHFDRLWVIDKEEEFAPDVDTQVVDSTLLWLQEEAEGDPLLLVLQLYGPHHPYCPPGIEDGIVEVEELHEGEVDLCDPVQSELLHAAESIVPFPPELSEGIEQLYDAEVAYTEAEIQRFLDGWAEVRSRPRVTVVVTDHGEAFGEHGMVLHGRSLHYETSDCHMGFHGEGIRRSVVDRPVELLDLAPTVLGLLEVEAPGTWRGLDLSPLFDDPQRPFEAHAYQVSSLLDTMQWAVTLEGEDGHRYRLLVWEDGRPSQLFDGTADPLETVDLHDDPSVADIQEQLELFMADMIATAETGGPARELL